jgi:hypothetical protein
MKLQDALDQVDQVSDDRVIFARKPWTLESEAEIAVFDADFRVPAEIGSRGLEYFLEVSIAIEALEVFGDRTPTTDERRALLLYYAENDAYPEWVYQS